MKQSKSIFHLIALLTVAVWGVTFVSTKILINEGLQPVTIFISRFAIAYLCTLALSHKTLTAHTPKDELLMLLAGISGGSLYFIAENTALQITYAENVSLIICSAPILTIILGRIIFKDKIKPIIWVGSAIAFIGVSIVVLNSSINHGINPLGDLLTLLAALSWAIYSLLIKKLSTKYSNTLINRKVFFYGLITAIAYHLIHPTQITINPAHIHTVILNLLFLGVLASFICYIMWTIAIKEIGAEKVSNYIYLNPVITIIASVIILAEPFSLTLLTGTTLVITGVILSTR